MTNAKPMVSIIMPTYNRATVLPRAINSILTQTYKNFELIIINDGSTDSTAHYLKGLRDDHIKVISQANAGAAKARNAGLELARGKYIAYLDSDNVWHDAFLEVMVECMQKNQLIYCSQNLLLCDVKGGEHRIIARKTRTTPYNPAALISGNYIDINAVMHTRAVLNITGNFDESLKTLEDWDLFTRIVIAYPFQVQHIDQVLCDYYFYTEKALPTISNTNFKNSSLKAFGLEHKDRDTLALRKKFRSIIQNSYK